MWLPPAVHAASVATLDCSRAAAGTGQVGVFMPAPQAATRNYISRFWTKFEATFTAGYDWRVFDRWHFCDRQATWVHSAASNSWAQLSAGSWAFWDNWNTGHVHVWEEQYYWQSQTWQGHYLGVCIVWQFFIFQPFWP